MSAINGPASPADMRDIKSIRNDLLEEIALNAKREHDASLFRAEVRSFNLRSRETQEQLLAQQRTMIRHLESIMAAPPRSLDTSSTQGRLESWLSRPATTRAMVYGLAIAGVCATASGCLVHPIAHMIGLTP